MDDDFLSQFMEPTDPEKTAALAAALRRQKDIGMLGMLTGDKVLSGFGQTLFGDAGRRESQSAHGPGVGRLRLALEAQKLSELDPELERQRAEADIGLKQARAGYLSQPRGRATTPQQEEYESLRNEKMRQQLSGQGGVGAKRQNDEVYRWSARLKGTGVAKGFKAFESIDSIVDKYGGVDKIPGVGYGKGLIPTEALPEDAQRFRQEGSALIAEYRNRLFGASLTPGEKSAFAEIASLGGRATAGQVASALGILRRGLSSDADQALAGAPESVKEPIYRDIGYKRPKAPEAAPATEVSTPGPVVDPRARREQIKKELEALRAGGGGL